MSPITKKSLFKGQYVLFGEYLEQSQLLYEKCCVLGYIFRDKLNAFLELLREGGDDKTLNEFIDQIGDPAAERLKSLKQTPKNFFDLFLESEGTKMMRQLYKVGLIKYSEWQDFPKVYNWRMRLDYALFNLNMVLLEGIGFGYRFPELTEKLTSYEFDKFEWRKYYEAGLDIGAEPPQTMVMPERQKKVLSLITPFIEQFYPDKKSTLRL